MFKNFQVIPSSELDVNLNEGYGKNRKKAMILTLFWHSFKAYPCFEEVMCEDCGIESLTVLLHCTCASN